MVDAPEDAILLALATSFMLALMAIVAGLVCYQIIRPADELLTDKVKSSGDGSFFSKLR